VRKSKFTEEQNCVTPACLTASAASRGSMIRPVELGSSSSRCPVAAERFPSGRAPGVFLEETWRKPRRIFVCPPGRRGASPSDTVTSPPEGPGPDHRAGRTDAEPEPTSLLAREGTGTVSRRLQ
jgi:hypothetical protein